MKKVFILISIFLGLWSCKQKIVRDVSVEIIFDHEIDIKLSKNDSLYTFLKPKEFNDTFLNIIPLFKKVDSEIFIIDSIHTTDGIIPKLQNWISQDKKNGNYFIKKRVKQIENTSINSLFSARGDKKFVDSFYAKNKTQLVIYSNKNYASLYRNLNGGGIKIFNSIDSLKLFIFSIKDSLSSKKARLNVIFEPELSLIPISPALETQTEPFNKNIFVPLDNKKEKSGGITATPLPPVEQKKISSISPEECDRRILLCLSKPQGEEKIIFFFQEIFRFVKTNECVNTSYKKLINDIYNNISFLDPPKFDKDINNTYFNLVCSNKTDFGSELDKYGIKINNSNYLKIFANCPQ